MTRKAFTVWYRWGAAMVIPGCEDENEAILRYLAANTLTGEGDDADFVVAPLFNADGSRNMREKPPRPFPSSIPTPTP